MIVYMFSFVGARNMIFVLPAELEHTHQQIAQQKIIYFQTILTNHLSLIIEPCRECLRCVLFKTYMLIVDIFFLYNICVYENYARSSTRVYFILYLYTSLYSCVPHLYRGGHTLCLHAPRARILSLRRRCCVELWNRFVFLFYIYTTTTQVLTYIFK